MKFKTFTRCYLKVTNRFKSEPIKKNIDLLYFSGDDICFLMDGKRFTVNGASRHFSRWEEAGKPLGEQQVIFYYRHHNCKSSWTLEFKKQDEQQNKEQKDMFKSLNLESMKKRIEVKNILMSIPQLIRVKNLPPDGEICFKMLPQGDFIEANVHFVAGKGMVLCSGSEDCFHCKKSKPVVVSIWQCYIIKSDYSQIKVGFIYPLGFTNHQVREMIERLEKFGDFTSLDNGKVCAICRVGDIVKFAYDEENSKPTIQELGMKLEELKINSAEYILQSFTK